MKETGCVFPIYIDPNRSLYNSFGLDRKIAAAMGSSVMRYYGEKMANGQSLPNLGGGEDTIQLGGDFTLQKKDWRLLMAYPSQTATDRPTVDHILRKCSRK